MSELKGYKGKIHDFLAENKVEVGDLIKITSELTYSGILMPRYESGDESHIVLKLKSGYNIGIEFEKIEKIEKVGEGQSIVESSQTIEKNESLPKILLLSTGGTIASKVDYRTGAVTPALSASELYEAVPEIDELPLTVNPVSVPRDVMLDAVIALANVVPLKVLDDGSVT